MVTIQRRRGQFTITLPKDVVHLMHWEKGIELYPYPNEEGAVILMPIKKGR